MSRHAPKSARAITRELCRVQALLRGEQLSPTEWAEQYGAQQALMWARGDANTAAPSKRRWRCTHAPSKLAPLATSEHTHGT